MLETSGDVLNLIIALCVLVFTFFLVWGLYYLVASVRKVYKLVNELDKIMNKAHETIDLVKTKVKKGGSYLYLLGEASKKIVDIVDEKVSARKKTRQKNKKTSKSSKQENSKK